MVMAMARARARAWDGMGVGGKGGEGGDVVQEQLVSQAQAQGEDPTPAHAQGGYNNIYSSNTLSHYFLPSPYSSPKIPYGALGVGKTASSTFTSTSATYVPTAHEQALAFRSPEQLLMFPPGIFMQPNPNPNVNPNLNPNPIPNEYIMKDHMNGHMNGRMNGHMNGDMNGHMNGQYTYSGNVNGTGRGTTDTMGDSAMAMEPGQYQEYGPEVGSTTHGVTPAHGINPHNKTAQGLAKEILSSMLH